MALALLRIGTETTWATVDVGGGPCATRTDGSLWCWGNNPFGELGAGDTDMRTSPARVGDAYDWASASLGALHTCAMRRDATVWCWGYNGDGSLGLGDTINRSVPVRLAF